MSARVIIECDRLATALELQARLQKWLARDGGNLYAATVLSSLKAAGRIEVERDRRPVIVTEPRQACDGCDTPLGVVRVVPITPGEPHHGNMLLCEDCYTRELAAGTWDRAPRWDECKVYGKED